MYFCQPVITDPTNYTLINQRVMSLSERAGPTPPLNPLHRSSGMFHILACSTSHAKRSFFVSLSSSTVTHTLKHTHGLCFGSQETDGFLTSVLGRDAGTQNSTTELHLLSFQVLTVSSISSVTSLLGRLTNLSKEVGSI